MFWHKKLSQSEAQEYFKNLNEKVLADTPRTALIFELKPIWISNSDLLVLAIVMTYLSSSKTSTPSKWADAISAITSNEYVSRGPLNNTLTRAAIDHYSTKLQANMDKANDEVMSAAKELGKAIEDAIEIALTAEMSGRGILIDNGDFSDMASLINATFAASKLILVPLLEGNHWSRDPRAVSSAKQLSLALAVINTVSQEIEEHSAIAHGVSTVTSINEAMQNNNQEQLDLIMAIPLVVFKAFTTQPLRTLTLFQYYHESVFEAVEHKLPAQPYWQSRRFS